MPPKAKITKDMVIDAAFEVVRKTGAENINARTVSEKLNCSTQPVMYHFATIEELKKAAYEKTDDCRNDASGADGKRMLCCFNSTHNDK